MRMPFRRAAAIPLVLLAAACGGGDDPPETGAGAMAGGMVMPSMEAGGAMDQMQQHLRDVADLSADSMVAALPAHRQRVADLLGQMNREMMDMNMPMDGAWKALADSLRADLSRMGDVAAPELPAFMKLHAARITRMMQTHSEMMGGTRM